MLSLLLLTSCQPSIDTLERAPMPRGKVTLGVIQQGVERDEVATLARDELTLELSAFYIVVADLELHACPEPTTRAALDWVIPPAHAHVPDSATRLGTPTLVDLLATTGRARILGEIAPPQGRYCTVRVVLAPADDDVVNLSELGPGEVTGHSVILEGRWRTKTQDGNEPATWHDISARLDLARAWSITLPEPITLDAKEQSAFVLIESVIDHALLQALRDAPETRPAPDDEKLAESILGLVASTQRRYRSPRQAAPE